MFPFRDSVWNGIDYDRDVPGDKEGKQEMNATTSISKEEFLDKIEKAKKALDDVPHYDRRYLLDDVLLDKLFELAYNSIPIEWIKKWANKNCMYCLDYDYPTEKYDGWYDINNMLKDWEKENAKAD